ncbi:MAG TPA: hypothetical protein VLC98_15230 [Phnomibacter sp.]|nr:hypothetical protein [Phnomibacter sp.]
MAISTAERRFIRNWEDQRKDGKASFIAIYSFGLSIVIFLSGVAVGLFSGLRFVTVPLLSALAVASVIGAVALSFFLFGRNQKKFRRIIQREIKAAQSA